MAARVVESRGAAGRRRRADAATGGIVEAGTAGAVGHRRAGAATIRPIEPGLLAGLRRQREQGERQRANPVCALTGLHQVSLSPVRSSRIAGL
jgi:hypothetical protein